jgi:3-methyladenine DNA glycosylase AlkD
MNISDIRNLLKENSNAVRAKNPLFFKTGSGDYAQHDQFLGVSVPALRKIARQFQQLSLEEISTLCSSVYNEERLLALFILIARYRSTTHDEEKRAIYDFYIAHMAHINNWNLVDASAHEIMGAYVFHHSSQRDILVKLAHSVNLWERRIAIIAMLYFIRQSDNIWTYKVAEILLHDKHDLIQKAVGWMLREAGKKDEKSLRGFLDKHAAQMPRTMLRYAIEKLLPHERTMYMKQ